MDLTQIYMASPDWLKLVWIVMPWITVYGLARLWRDVRVRRPAVAAFSETARPLFLDRADLQRLRLEDLPELRERLALPAAEGETG